jgi:hypothetical protein
MERARSGVRALELFQNGSGYKVWSVDEHACPRCAAHVLAGWGDRPVAEHHDEDFTEHAARCEVKVT